MTMGSFEVYETETRRLVHVLFHRKHAWEPLHLGRRLSAAAKHLIKK